jgi:hypothetical protein
MAPTRFRWLIGAAILILVAAVISIGLIAGGVFDPAPLGALQWELQERQLDVASQSREIAWLQEEVPEAAITIRAMGTLESGEEDIGYGLVWGDEQSYVAFAVSPLGYLALWEAMQSGDATMENYFLQWQTWPHVKEDHEPNEIWVDITGDHASVRVNREWLWEGDIGERTRRVGLLGESFAGSSVVNFSKVELFAAN